MFTSWWLEKPLALIRHSPYMPIKGKPRPWPLSGNPRGILPLIRIIHRREIIASALSVGKSAEARFSMQMCPYLEKTREICGDFFESGNLFLAETVEDGKVDVENGDDFIALT